VIKYNQILVIADPIIPRLNKPKVDWDINSLIEDIKNTKVVYTSLLPGPELEAASIAFQYNIPYIVTTPYRDIYQRWPIKIQYKYKYFLKKALTNLEIDRLHPYISNWNPPDKYEKQKIRNQVDYILEKINLFDGITKIFSYSTDTYSVKTSKVNSFLESIDNTHNWHLSLNTYYRQYEIEDDLPF